MLDTVFLTGLYLTCGNGVHPEVLHAIVKTESAQNPYVIANVTDKESYYLATREEAIYKANQLKDNGKKYSVGLMQIFSENFNHYGLSNENAFDYCTNIKTGSSILKECFERSKTVASEDNDTHLNMALSCYYSGNFKRGFVNDENMNSSYVARIKKNFVSIFEVPSFSNYQYSSYEYAKQKEVATMNSVKEIEPITNNDWDIFNDFNSQKEK